MPALLSQEQICNQALDYLHDAPIASINEGTKRADWFLRNYDQQRRVALTSLPWNFARDYWDIPQDPTVPGGPWKYRYRRPADLLRMEPLREAGNKSGERIPYELRRGYILTDYSENPLPVSGWVNITNPGEFTNLFVEVFAMRMAVKLSHFITGKASLRQELRANLADLLEVANRNELRESPYSTPKPDRNMPSNNRVFATYSRKYTYARQ